MDSLRYWVEECHVDGFRFDLATSLGARIRAFDPNAVFFDAVRQDPVLSRVKLIAEPWDLGAGRLPGRQLSARLGGVERPLSRRHAQLLEGRRRAAAGLRRAACSARPTSSSKRGRKPWASVNFVTAHDGFTLADLYAYNDKHNEANGEDNRDGHDDNRSWNCGVEGPTDDPGDPRPARPHAPQR